MSFIDVFLVTCGLILVFSVTMAVVVAVIHFVRTILSGDW